MNRMINSSLAKVGLVALALSLGGAITVSGSLSPALPRAVVGAEAEAVAVAVVVVAVAVAVVAAVAAAVVWEGEAAAEAAPV